MEHSFIIGDKVVLKTGSKPMTIVRINDGVASCQWYDSDKKENPIEPFQLEEIELYIKKT